jgi:hypothetical protein
MPKLTAIYAFAWGCFLLAAPLACVYGLIKASPPLTRRRIVGVAILGLLLSALLAFALATTTLQPLALVILPAPLIFAYSIFDPSVMLQKRLRAYLSLLRIGLGIALDIDVLVDVHGVETVVGRPDYRCVTIVTDE